MARRGLVALAGLLGLALVLGGLTWGITSWFGWWNVGPLPPPQGCTATVGTSTAFLDLEQASNAAIISGVTVARGLPPRAASIALATAWQESGIRNLAYGDRDSLGLFQQRPSQGWGTKEQVMDTRYATNRFLDALVRVPGWQVGDINDVAQKVQRSGVPEGYRPHVEAARLLASVLTGQTHEGWTCVSRATEPGDAEGLATSIRKTFGKKASVTVDAEALAITASDEDVAWAVAAYAMAQTGVFGTQSVQVAGQRWEVSGTSLAPWAAASGSPDQRTVGVVVRS